MSLEKLVVQESNSDLENIRNFKDLAREVMLLDGSYITTGWSPDNPGDPSKGVSTNKFDWLVNRPKKYRLDEWWIYDNQGNGHNLGQITRKLNPQWREGESWLGDMTKEDEIALIKEAWLEASYIKANRIATATGGVALAVENPSMETGVATVIILKENDGYELLFRGVRHQGSDVLQTQVSGMLRTGVDAQGNEAHGLVNVERWSTVVADEQIRQGVYQFAEDPTEEQMQKIIGLYKAMNQTILATQAKEALGSIKRRMARDISLSFAEALANLHVDLFEGNVGNSPFVATSSRMGGTYSFTGKCGTVTAFGLHQDRISPVKVRGGEKLVKGWIGANEIVAIVPIDMVYSEKTEVDRDTVIHDFDRVGYEIMAYTSKTS